LPIKIRILHLIKSLGRGGAEKLIPETVRVHNQERFQFYCIYFFHQQNNIVDELEQVGVKVHLIPSGNLGLFFQVNKVKDFIAEHDIQIIHAHLPWAGILSRLVGKDLHIPIVYTEHNTWDRYNKVSYWGNRMTFKNQDVAIAVSNEVALSMQLNSIFDPYKRGGRLQIKVIQNGVNTEVFKRMENEKTENEKIEIEFPNLKSELEIPSDSKVIGKVAVFRTQKRLWIWVDLALKILEQSPATHFLLVGDGDWRERILEQINESGKAENFHWVGVQKQVIPYLSIMDIYLSTSEFEGLPIAMLEAMACEVPVVATRAGGIGEMVQHGVQGFLTEIEGYEDLVSHCLSLLTNPLLHDQMAKAARKRVVKQFSMQRMVKELEEVYEGVIRKSVDQ
jgi:L-malate glycosyltransferase